MDVSMENLEKVAICYLKYIDFILMQVCATKNYYQWTMLAKNFVFIPITSRVEK